MEIKKGVLTLQPNFELGDLIIVESQLEPDKNGAYFLVKNIEGNFALSDTKGKLWNGKLALTLDGLMDYFTKYHAKESYTHYPASTHKLVVSPKKQGS